MLFENADALESRQCRNTHIPKYPPWNLVNNPTENALATVRLTGGGGSPLRITENT